MKILCGGPTRENTSDLFHLHRDALQAQQSPRYNLDIQHDVVPPLPEQSLNRWTTAAIERVAGSRQRFLLHAAIHHDALFMVDSDVICGPGVLERLLSVDAPVVYGVYWSTWPGKNRRLPQVWDVNPYGHTVESFDLLQLPGSNNVEVLGGGGCTLIRKEAFKSRYYPLLKSLKHSGGLWYGEDRTFCLGLEFLQLTQIAVTGLPVIHCYEPHQQTPKALATIRKDFEILAYIHIPGV